MTNPPSPSNKWELKTREILREALPEYDIDTHMRLTNVVKGRIKETSQMAMYELDFTIREKATGYVICVVELDGWQHNTLNGKRKDAKKNQWLAEARIQLIRIKKPEEASHIRNLIQQLGNLKITQENKLYSFEHKPTTKITKKLKASALLIIFVVLIMWGFYKGTIAVLNNMGKKAVTQQQQLQKQNQQWADQQRLAMQQKTQQATEVQEKIVATQPHYEQRVVKGKSVRECEVDGAITNASLKCMKDHYETVLVSGNQ